MMCDNIFPWQNQAAVVETLSVKLTVNRIPASAALHNKLAGSERTADEIMHQRTSGYLSNLK